MVDKESFSEQWGRLGPHQAWARLASSLSPAQHPPVPLSGSEKAV